MPFSPPATESVMSSQSLSISPPRSLHSTRIPIEGRIRYEPLARMIVTARLANCPNAKRLPNKFVMLNGGRVGHVLRVRQGHDHIALHISITSAEAQRAIVAGALDSLILFYECGPAQRDVRFFDIELDGGAA